MSELSSAQNSVSTANGLDPRYDLAARVRARESERYTLHSKHLNEMWVRVLKTIGYDVGFTRGVGSC